MATVIHLPKDERFAGIGAGLGQIAKGYTDKKTEDEKKEKRAEQLDQVFADFEDPNVEFSRARVMATLTEFESAEQVQIANSMATRSDQVRSSKLAAELEENRQSFQAGESEKGREFQKGEGAAGRKGQLDIAKLRVGSAEGIAKSGRESAKDLSEAAIKSREGLATAGHEATAGLQQNRQDFQAAQTEDDQKFRADQATADRFHRETLAKLPFEVSKEQGAYLAQIPGLDKDLADSNFGQAIAKIATDTNLSGTLKSSLLNTFIGGLSAENRLKAAEAKAKTAGQKEHTFKVTLPDQSVSKIVSQPGELPKDALARLIREQQFPEGTQLGTFSEGRRDVNSILQVAGLDPENPEHIARANKFADSEDAVRRQLDTRFGIQRDLDSGLVTSLLGGDKSALVKHELATAAVQDIMLGDPASGGTSDVGKAAQQASQVAEDDYNGLEWVPPEIVNNPNKRNVLDYAVSSRGYGAKEIQDLGKLLGLAPNQINAYIALKFEAATPEEAQKILDGG